MSYGLQQKTTFQFCRDDAFEFVELQSGLREIATRFFYSYLQICRRVTARLICWYRYSTGSPAPSPRSVINYITVLKQRRISECNCSPFPQRHTHIPPLPPHPPRIFFGCCCCCFVVLRPRSTSEAMSGRSVFSLSGLDLLSG